MHGRAEDHKPSHLYNAGTEHVGCSPTRQTLHKTGRGQHTNDATRGQIIDSRRHTRRGVGHSRNDAEKYQENTAKNVVARGDRRRGLGQNRKDVAITSNIRRVLRLECASYHQRHIFTVVVPA